jgi:agmatine deiminase
MTGRTQPIPEQHRGLMRGYRMPAEWEPHQATYLVWPHNRDTWPGKFKAIPPIFAGLAAAIAEFEPVRILVNRESEIAEVREMVRAAAAGTSMGQVEVVAIPTNDSWIRDSGPIFVNRIGAGGLKQIALDWRFNSWGEKYGSFDLDDAVPRRLAERYGFEVIEPGIVLEGGSIDSNGAGSILTTESCLLNPNRNPELGRPEIEDYLKTYLGAANVLWLGQGIAGDDTDGHVDDLARFAARGTIVSVTEHDRQDANYVALENNLKRLAAMRDQDGRPFRIETLPMPPALVCDDTRLPASYANFYLLNGGVLMPTFECAADSIAAATLARLFPRRRVVGIPSTDLVWGLGAVHCLTQQHPRG